MMAESTFYHELDLRPIVNAAGKLTTLGASIQSDFVADAMRGASQHFLDMDELMARAGHLIAGATGADGGFVTSCAAAGISIATAACITGTDLTRAEELPYPSSPPYEILIQRGHSIHFGASIVQIMRLGGAKVTEIGATNRTVEHQLRGAISEQTAGVMYVVSHHARQSGTLSLEDTVRVAHKHDLPVIVDAAAELDLRRQVESGADLVIYSGHKSLNAPTSGIIAGRRDLIEACKVQNKGIGRAMKIGKENIVGCLGALHQYLASSNSDSALARAEKMAEALSGFGGLRSSVVSDVVRPEIVRLRLTVDEKSASLSAAELVSRLQDNTPSIRTRNHGLEQGFIDIDFRTLQPADDEIIINAVRRGLS